MEFFLVRISVFRPNAGRYGPEKNPYLGAFHTVHNAMRTKFNFSHLIKTIAMIKSFSDNLVHRKIAPRSVANSK